MISEILSWSTCVLPKAITFESAETRFGRPVYASQAKELQLNKFRHTAAAGGLVVVDCCSQNQAIALCKRHEVRE